MICDQCKKDHEKLSWSERWQCYGIAMEKINQEKKKEQNNILVVGIPKYEWKK